MTSTGMRPSEITHEIRNAAAGASLTAQTVILSGEHALTQTVIDPLAETIMELSRALNLAADLLDSHQKFLISLRNDKADAI